MARSKKSAPPPEPVAPPAEAPAPKAAAVTDVTRVIDLDPEDYAWAAWRKRPVLKRPEPAPFDFAACRKRLKDLRKDKYKWVNWDEAQIAHILTRKEAHFWFLAMVANYENLSPPDVSERIAEKEVTGTIEVADAVQRIKDAKRFQPPHGMRAILNLFDPLATIELLLGEEMLNFGWHPAEIALEEFGRYVLPYLIAAQVKQIKDELRPRIDLKNWPVDTYNHPPMAFFLAALVGMPDELLPVAQSISNGWAEGAHRVVFGLGSPQVVEAEARRLKLPLRQPEELRAWLALTEFAGLDYARTQILAAESRADCEELIAAFARVKAPEVAPFMLELKLNSKAPIRARQWLDEQVGNAVAGLLPTATGRGKLAEGAVEYLRDAKKKGHEAVIRAALKGAAPETAEAIRKTVLDFVVKEYPLLDAKTTPADLKAAFADAKPKKWNKLPAWAHPSSLPPVVVNDRRLSDEQVTAVLAALQASVPGKPEPLVAAVKKHGDPAALDAFAWKLFQLWQADGYPSKEKWAMGAIGPFGGDGSALKLTPLIRNWPGESQHQRAVFGLECLRAVGSDTALMQLNGISQKLKFKGLKEKATRAMEAIAKEKGLTRAQLEDRVVPDCDLDERGDRVFDFGPRQFRFVLGTDMKPMLKDADGKVKTDLPKPGTKDDAAKANEAVAAWKLMKKQITAVATLQADRLEQAMVTGRRWPVADFQALLLKHPLMIHLVRLLLWGGYDKAGKLTATFRVTEDQTLADAKDAAYTPKGVAEVGVVHPLHLSDEQKSAWGEVFSDYEIVPPFPQLGRSIHRLEKDEAKATELTRYKGVALPAPSLVFGLEKYGWVRGRGMDGGGFDEHSKPFPGSGVTAVVHYDGGVAYGYIDPNSSITFEQCYFVSGVRGPSGYAHREKTLPLGEVDPVAVSEVLSDLSALAAKAK